jgi:hypothetical protein
VIREAEQIADAARHRCDRAATLRSALERAAAALSVRVAPDSAFARLFSTTGQCWREEETTEGERLSIARGSVRASAADLGAQSARLRDRANGCSQSVALIDRRLSELQAFEEKIHSDLEQCRAILDEISEIRGHLESILTDVSR